MGFELLTCERLDCELSVGMQRVLEPVGVGVSE
jgi:hypothetical protein